MILYLTIFFAVCYSAKSFVFEGKHKTPIIHRVPTVQPKAKFSPLYSGQPQDDDSAEFESTSRYELLMCINFQSIVIQDYNQKLQSFVQSFPYAAVLPVQPMHYVPSENGVTITFLRKKTKEKGSQDGGIQIDIVSIHDDNHLQLTMKRISEGQTVSKIFSEKLIVIQLLDRLKSWVDDQSGLEITSVYHKWM